MNSNQLALEAYLEGIRSGDRRMLGRAITLIESTRPDHQEAARALIERCMPFTGEALRVGITGPPGAGKSTFIDALGMQIVETGQKVAVLAIDPSSQKSRGSILGDKTRMQRLAVHPDAFVRPSPTSGSLGGIALKTREAMTLCEAAGYEVIFVETVGVGQSEFSVHGMVDVLLLLLITGAGDELQGIKRGIMEMADLLVVNKADGENEIEALKLKKSLQKLIHALPDDGSGWTVPVVTASALSFAGIEEIWTTIKKFQQHTAASGQLQKKRREQAIAWMHRYIDAALRARFDQHPYVQKERPQLETDVLNGKISPIGAAERLLKVLSEEKGVRRE